jgi:hypothetical protein
MIFSVKKVYLGIIVCVEVCLKYLLRYIPEVSMFLTAGKAQ